MAKKYDNSKYQNLKSQKSANEKKQESYKSEINDIEAELERLRSAYNTLDDAKEALEDIKNIHSGNAMKKIGMHYCYSYKEVVMPKNIPVIFRMYQINLDGKKRIYQKYWNQYEHFIEEDI